MAFDTPDGPVQAIQDVSFQLDAGQTLGIVGESGSGKSVSTQALVGLLRGATITGRSSFNGDDLLTMSTAKLRAVRGAEIAMVFQDPLSSLHPLYRVGWQIVEQIRVHEKLSKRAARKRAVELLRLVGIPQPDRRIDDYPHQFSGGMRQRAMIAMAMSLRPQLLIADEPTTALDVTVQAQVLEVMRRLQEEFGTALIVITHDLGVIADIADNVCVMYGGRVIETAPLRDIFYAQHHPYTAGLLRSIPSADTAGRRLNSISGRPPSLVAPPSGCAFHPRCPHAMDVCRLERPALQRVMHSNEHRSACWLPSASTRMTDSLETLALGKPGAVDS
ncbi:ABC transporter ATP-binding protein [Mycolicibacterium sp. P9-64]|uniref:ABC transporter ATP-binding protein n=1 Tax=Mycolicibacterium sp. P9-64 TaxID=2024612 RepID=UPI001F5BB4E7|nr:ABC transporter ATP-binding protein [Mycolicibacterium sp. P9-64]